jgi:hypothetical protein
MAPRASLLPPTLVALLLAALPACKEAGPTANPSDPAPALAGHDDDDVLSGGTGGEPKPLPDGVRDVEGVVVRARGGTVVIQPPDGETVVLGLAGDVPVTVEGQTASADQVTEGMRVRAAYTFEGGDARAVRIEAERTGR